MPALAAPHRQRHEVGPAAMIHKAQRTARAFGIDHDGQLVDLEAVVGVFGAHVKPAVLFVTDANVFAYNNYQPASNKQLRLGGHTNKRVLRDICARKHAPTAVRCQPHRDVLGVCSKQLRLEPRRCLQQHIVTRGSSLCVRLCERRSVPPSARLFGSEAHCCRCVTT